MFSKKKKVDKPKPAKVETKQDGVSDLKKFVFIVSLISGADYKIERDQISFSNIDCTPASEAQLITLEGFPYEENKYFSPNIIKQVRWEER